MNADSANRSFFALLAVAVVPYALLGLSGCGVLSLVGYRLATHGLSGLTQGGDDLRPAAVFFAFVTGGTAVALLSARRQVRATRRLAQVIAEASCPLTPQVVGVAKRLGLEGRVDVWADPRPCSFTYGLLAPRVAVSQGLVEAVGEDELAAVLYHERYHVRHRDTVKMVVARAAPSAFFYLPVLRALRDRYLAARELSADQRAVRAVGERALASALYKALDAPALPDLGAAAALGGRDHLDARVAQLELGAEPPLPALSRVAVAITAAGLAVLTAMLVLGLLNGGAGGMSMDSSLVEGSGLGVMASVLGALLCAGGWVAGAVFLARRVRRHAHLA